MIRQTLGIKAGNNGDMRDGGSKRWLRGSKGKTETRWFDVGKTGKRERKGKDIRERRERRKKGESDRQGNTSHT